MSIHAIVDLLHGYASMLQECCYTYDKIRPICVRCKTCIIDCRPGKNLRGPAAHRSKVGWVLSYVKQFQCYNAHATRADVSHYARILSKLTRWDILLLQSIDQFCPATLHICNYSIIMGNDAH
jgi:hypothetical protein